MLELVFWGCLLLVAYTYLLYPLVLFLAYALEQLRRDLGYLGCRRDRRRSALQLDELPAVSVVIPAFNEEVHLAEKLANLRELDYPTAKLEVVFVSDGSTDRTNAILKALEDVNVQTVFLPVRRGKPNALNHGVARATHDILIFSDAATLFEPDALRKLVRHFADPKVGVVCATLQFRGTAESRQTEGVYWKYESMLRLMENRLGATLTASGAMYALRRQCYRPLLANVLVEDFVIPMNARALGYRVLYDPEAIGTEVAADSVAGEFTRRVRIAVGSFRALGEFVRTPLRPFACVAFVSHKLLRWILPALLIGLLASSAILQSIPIYRALLAAQCTFYIWALAGYVFHDRLQGVRFGLLAYYLMAIHLAYLVGFVRFVRGRDTAVWQRVS